MFALATYCELDKVEGGKNDEDLFAEVKEGLMKNEKTVEERSLPSGVYRERNNYVEYNASVVWAKERMGVDEKWEIDG